MHVHTGVLSVQRGFYLPSRDVVKRGASSTAAVDVQTRYNHRERIISQTTPLKLSTLLDPEYTCTSPIALWMYWDMEELLDRGVVGGKKITQWRDM